MNPIVNVSGLSKRYGDNQVLEHLDLQLQPDQLCVLLGSNGAGKSTLLRALIGLERVNAERLTVLGFDARRQGDQLRRHVGWVPDESDVPKWMTPADCARFHAGRFVGWSDDRLTMLFERMQVPTGRRFGALSRGEAAKAMLALALASAPRLLILDEPLARLDPHSRDQVLACLLEEAPVKNGACLLATHDLDVAVRAADRVLVLEDGRIRDALDTQELTAAHDEPGGLKARLASLYGPRPTELVR